MTRRRTPEQPATTRARKPDRSPRSGTAWSAFRRGLAEALRVLEAEEYLVLAASESGYFVQFAAQGEEGMRAEAVSNTFITRGAPLSDGACRDLQDLGWRPPTYTPSAETVPPSEGSPNFFVELSPPIEHARLAALVVRTLRTIYRIRHPEELAYKSFSRGGMVIRLPMLTIPREVSASSRSDADDSTTSEKVKAASPRSPEDVLSMRPDRRPIATETVGAQNYSGGVLQMGFTDDYLERCWKRRAVWRGKKTFPGDWYLAGDPLALRLVGEAETTSLDFQRDDVAFVPDADDLLELIHHQLRAAGADPVETSLTIAYDPDKLWSIDIRCGDGSRYNTRKQTSIHSGLLYALQVMAQSRC